MTWFDAAIVLGFCALALGCVWFLMASDGESDIVDEEPTLDTRNRNDR